MNEEEARKKASAVFEKLASTQEDLDQATALPREDRQETGSARSAALFSFFSFSLGAVIPILPLIFGLSGIWAAVVALALVGISLLFTGGITGVLSGKPPLYRAMRQLLIGFGAAAITYSLGLLFGMIL